MAQKAAWSPTIMGGTGLEGEYTTTNQKMTLTMMRTMTRTLTMTRTKTRTRMRTKMSEAKADNDDDNNDDDNEMMMSIPPITQQPTRR